MRGLRGTWLDPFRYTRDRREEVALIAWYETVLTRVAACASTADPDIIRRILSAPLEMRGYGVVKSEAVARVRPEAEALLARLETPGAL